MIDFITLASWFQHYGIVGMVGVFILIYVTTYWPSRRETIEQHGKIILGDDR
jgi:cbb3-type cytochrome oxidase subunit 3